MNPLRFGSLFAGIGGLDLGLERAGMECAFQVEIADYPTKILEKHWPNVPKLRDICAVKGADLPSVDVLCGGFPCQDLSSAGKRAGITGARSGLWKEYLRLIQEIKPEYVIAENVAALLFKNAGFSTVLEDLSACGYDAEWQVLPAAAFGAPHLRERVFIVAYSNSERQASGDGPFTRSGHMAEVGQNIGALDWNGVSIDRKSAEAVVMSAQESLRAAPLFSRLDDGISEVLGALAGYGNAIVPQVAEFVGRCVVEFHQNRLRSIAA